MRVIFVLGEEYTFRTRTLSFAFPSCQRESPSLNDGGLLPPTFDTATVRVGVLAVGMQFLVTHVIAGANGISNCFLTF